MRLIYIFSLCFLILTLNLQLSPLLSSAVPLNVDFIYYEGSVNMLLNLKMKSSSGPHTIPNAFLRRYAEIYCLLLFYYISGLFFIWYPP